MSIQRSLLHLQTHMVLTRSATGVWINREKQEKKVYVVSQGKQGEQNGTILEILDSLEKAEQWVTEHKLVPLRYAAKWLLASDCTQEWHRNDEWLRIDEYIVS